MLLIIKLSLSYSYPLGSELYTGQSLVQWLMQALFRPDPNYPTVLVYLQLIQALIQLHVWHCSPHLSIVLFQYFDKDNIKTINKNDKRYAYYINYIFMQIFLFQKESCLPVTTLTVSEICNKLIKTFLCIFSINITMAIAGGVGPLIICFGQIVKNIRQTQSTKTQDFQFRSPFCS